MMISLQKNEEEIRHLGFARAASQWVFHQPSEERESKGTSMVAWLHACPVPGPSKVEFPGSLPALFEVPESQTLGWKCSRVHGYGSNGWWWMGNKFGMYGAWWVVREGIVSGRGHACVGDRNTRWSSRGKAMGKWEGWMLAMGNWFGRGLISGAWRANSCCIHTYQRIPLIQTQNLSLWLISNRSIP